MCASIWEKFKFDVLIIDYPQLLNLDEETSHLESIKKIYTSLQDMAQKYNCALIAPAQTFKMAQDKPLHDLTSTQCQSISYTSSVVISLNMTDEERASGHMRLHLAKNRGGIGDKTYPVFIDFEHCRLVP